MEKNQLYFFNNQYDDEIIWKALTKARNKNYYRCLGQQDVLEEFHSYTFNFKDFTVNKETNALLGVSENAYTLYTEISLIPYYTKKRFLDKYGYNTPVSIDEIIRNPRIFKYFVYGQLGVYFYFNMKLAECIDGCYIIIEPKGVQINSKTLDEYYKWIYPLYVSIRLMNQTDIYYSYRNKLLLFKDNIEGDQYKIDLGLFTNLTNFNKPDTINEWTLYISADATNDALMIGVNATIDKENNQISIPLEAANCIIKSSSNCRCYLINEYQRNKQTKTIGMDDFHIVGSDADDIPIWGASFLLNVDNPISLRNIFTYLIDKNTGIKYGIQALRLKQIDPIDYENGFVLKNYNAIDDTFEDIIPKTSGNKSSSIKMNYYIILLSNSEFSALDDLISYFITSNNQMNCEIGIEYYSMDTEYDNISAPIYHRYDTKDTLEDFVKNKASDAFLEYRPVVMTPYDCQEYLNFEDYPDLRAFRLKCLKEIMEDNPMRLKDLQKDLDRKNNLSIRMVYRESECQNIFSRSVTRGVTSDTDGDYILFESPMMYLCANMANDIMPSAILFINGRRANIQYIASDRGMVYFYFERRYLEPDIDNVVEIEIFIYDTSKSHKNEIEFKFFSSISNILIPEADQFDFMSLRNLMVVDKNTLMTLKPEEISYKYTMNQLVLSNPTDEYEFLYDEDNFNWFMTNVLEFFEDDDTTKYAVRKSTTLIDATELPYKRLDLERVYMKLNSSHRLNHTLIITNTNNHRKVYVPTGSSSNSFTMKVFKESSNKERFRVYYGGKLLRENDYELSLPSKYGDDVTVSIKNISTSNKNQEVIFEYLPIEEEIIFEGIPDTSIYHDELFWFDHLDRALLTSELKIYINGYRITMNEIVDIGVFNVFSIPVYTIGSYIVIYKTADDKVSYIEDKRALVMNTEIRKNAELLEYLLENK